MQDSKMKIIHLFFYLLSIVAITISCLSCSALENPKIYSENREWRFTLSKSNSKFIDTISLKVFGESWKISQKKIEWNYSLRDSSGYSTITETTGVIDRSESSIFKKEIWIHPPRSTFMRLTELVPFPQIIFPIRQGEVLPWELTPKEGWEELKGVKVTGQVEVVGKIYYDNPIIKDSCWVLNAVGNSTAGNYKAKFYFNENAGFVYFNYDFNTYKVVMELISFKK
jgi:hypothetical protein